MKIRHVLHLLLLVSIPHVVASQANLDSLNAIYENEEQHDTTRLSAIGELAKNYLTSTPDSALYFAQIQYDFAAMRNAKKYMAEALVTLGQSSYKRQEYENARTYYSKSNSIWKQLNNTSAYLRVLNYIGESYEKPGDASTSKLFYDSIIPIAIKTKDTARLITGYRALIRVKYYSDEDYEGAIKACDEIINIMRIQEDSVQLGINLYYRGLFTSKNNQNIEAIDYLSKAVEVTRKTKDYVHEINSLHYIGYSFKLQGNFIKASEIFFEALDVCVLNDDKDLEASTLEKIGILFLEQEEFDKALEYHQKCMNLRKELKREELLTISINNIAIVYYKKKEYDKAEQYHRKSLAISQKLGIKHRVAYSNHNIGELKLGMGEYDSALYYFNIALKLKTELKSRTPLALTYNGIGRVYGSIGNYKKAIDYNLRSLQIGRKYNRLDIIRESLESLHSNYEKLGQYKRSLKIYKEYISYRDSTLNEENKNELLMHDLKYNYEKKALADSITAAELLKRKEDRIALEVLQSERMQRQANYLYFILFIVLVLLITLANRFILIRKQKRIIEAQKAEVDEVNFELVEKNNEVLTQAEELHEVNEEIRLMNENLEQLVQSRTKKIQQQNEKLTQYAFSNSHKVRAPLARLMGLIDLWKQDSVTGKEREYVLDKISYSALELDAIVRDITANLSEEDEK